MCLEKVFARMTVSFFLKTYCMVAAGCHIMDPAVMVIVHFQFLSLEREKRKTKFRLFSIFDIKVFVFVFNFNILKMATIEGKACFKNNNFSVRCIIFVGLGMHIIMYTRNNVTVFTYK